MPRSCQANTWRNVWPVRLTVRYACSVHARRRQLTNGHPHDPVVRAFGTLSIEDGLSIRGPRDLGGARPKHVLQILLAARGRPVPKERISFLLWGDQLPRNATGSLQTFVSMLRRRLTPDPTLARRLVATEPEAYRFAPELVQLDLDRFDELLERSAQESTRTARDSLERALTLVRGEVFEDEPYATWALDLRASYQGRILGAHLDAADGALAELAYEPALAHAESAIALDGFSERARRTEMLSLYALSRTHEALSRYRDFRLRLDEQLGLDPSPESRALEAAILRQEDVRALLPRPLRRERVDASPQPSRMLGRTEELDLLARSVDEGLRGRPTLVLIQGDSGLGKTRLLDQAEGLLAGVRVGRAGCAPIEQHLPYVPLAAALRRALADIDVRALPLPALAEVLPELAVNAPRSRHDDVEVLEALVMLLAEHAPVGLLIDDLQWADGSTLAALSYLRSRASTTALVMITTTTPGTAGEVQLLPEPDTLIPLEPLTAEDVASLGQPGLYETTGGHPRFIAEELAATRPSQRSCSLTDALIAQCQSEGERSYRILATASVLEQPFLPELLAELLESDLVLLIEQLERLCQRRILRIDGLGFRFRYDLVRHVLCEEVSPARRKLLGLRLNQLAHHTVGAASERVSERAG